MPSQKMSTPDLWSQVENEMKKYDLLTHPFYQAWTEGVITERELAFYGWQYFIMWPRLLLSDGSARTPAGRRNAPGDSS